MRQVWTTNTSMSIHGQLQGVINFSSNSKSFHKSLVSEERDGEKVLFVDLHFYPIDVFG
jgi:hypothetical protein